MSDKGGRAFSLLPEQPWGRLLCEQHTMESSTRDIPVLSPEAALMQGSHVLTALGSTQRPAGCPFLLPSFPPPTHRSFPGS